MESTTSSSSPALPEYQINPARPHRLLAPLLCFFFYIFSANIPTTTSLVQNANKNTSPNPNSNTKISYTQHCNNVVSASPVPANTSSSSSPVTFQNLYFAGFFSGGDVIFNETATNSTRALEFLPIHYQKTSTSGVYKVQASLHLRNRVVYSVFGNPKRQIEFRGRSQFAWRLVTSFSLSGYWSEASGKLCMVGSKMSYQQPGNAKRFSAVLKLNYPLNSSIYGSLISGTLESLSDYKGNSSYFEPISMLGFGRFRYRAYTFVVKENWSDCLSGVDERKNEPLSTRFRDVCLTIHGLTSRFALEYKSDCGSKNCNPFGGSIGYLPTSMFYHGIWCREHRKVQMMLGFPNSNYTGHEFPFDPNTLLIAEGQWDEKENRLCGVACRILNFTGSWANAVVGDCSIRLSLIFPAIWSLRNRSTIVGEIWSEKDVNSTGYFDKIGFQAYSTREMHLQGLKYDYTQTNNIRKSCAEGKTVGAKGKTYPDGHSPDMRFGMYVRKSKGKEATGISSPLFVADWLYPQQHFVLPVPRPNEPAAFQLSNSHSSILNISYMMSFTPPPDFKFIGETSSGTVDISAEGIYERDTGLLCMIGCRHVGSTNQNLIREASLDCEMVIKVQFPPMRAEQGEVVNGTIESTRAKSDPLYFEQLQLAAISITDTQAKASIWRMDLEISILVISKTLACVFVVLQIFYVKKNGHVLPFISIQMLIVLTLGHMIPLLLNFDALFAGNRKPTNNFLGSGGWLEVNKVMVRVVAMAAFLLQLRLLQLTWSARQSDRNRKELWVSERKAMYVILPMYIAGGLVTWFVHQWKDSYRRPMGRFERPHRRAFQLNGVHPLSYQHNSFWEDLESYAGLLLDGFLLPQILFNLGR